MGALRFGPREMASRWSRGRGIDDPVSFDRIARSLAPALVERFCTGNCRRIETTLLSNPTVEPGKRPCRLKVSWPITGNSAQARLGVSSPSGVIAKSYKPQSSSGLAQTLQRGDFAVGVGLIAKCGEVGQVPAAQHQVTVRLRRISPTMPTMRGWGRPYLARP